MLDLEERLVDYNVLKDHKDNYSIENYNEINKVLSRKIDDPLLF